MAFWWPLLVLAAAYALCRLLLFLIPPTVPSIEVDAADGTAPFYPISILFIQFMPRVRSFLSEGFPFAAVLAKEDSFIYVRLPLHCLLLLYSLHCCSMYTLFSFFFLGGNMYTLFSPTNLLPSSEWFNAVSLGGLLPVRVVPTHNTIERFVSPHFVYQLPAAF